MRKKEKKCKDELDSPEVMHGRTLGGVCRPRPPQESMMIHFNLLTGKNPTQLALCFSTS